MSHLTKISICSNVLRKIEIPHHGILYLLEWHFIENRFSKISHFNDTTITRHEILHKREGEELQGLQMKIKAF